MAEQKPIEELTYEEAFAELEDVVAAMEAGDSSLEEATALFARGQALVKRCAALLEQAELKVRLLNGEKFEEFEPPL
jgi:exodeoxyribonuclease VII small subunit